MSSGICFVWAAGTLSESLNQHHLKTKRNQRQKLSDLFSFASYWDF